MSQLMFRRAGAKDATTDGSETPLAEAERIKSKTVSDCKTALADALAEAEKLRDNFLKTAAEYAQQVKAVRDMMYKACPPYDVENKMSAEEKADISATKAKISMCLDLRKLCEGVEWY